MRQSHPLSTHLALFAAGIGVPLLLLALLVGWGSLGEERARIDREAERLVGGIVGDVERELAALTATAQTLATANALVRDHNYERFYQRAKAIQIRGGGWVVVWNPSGQQLVNTLVPWGTPLIRQPVPDLDPAIFERGETYVSDPFVGNTAGKRIFAVAVPVRDPQGGIPYGLALVLPVEHLTRTIRGVALPSGWIATLNDRKHHIAARTLNPERWVGQPMAEAGRRLTERVPPGVGGLWKDILTVEGEPVRGAYHRMPNGWLVSASATHAVYEAPVWRLLGVGTTFLVAFVAASAVMASLVGRRILLALRGLSFKAEALMRNEVVEPPVTPIAEFNAVIAIIRKTAEDIRRRDEHRTLLINELNHRVKNTLATVQSLARRTFRTADPALYRTFEARLIALSASHTLLTETNWSGANIHDVVNCEARIYGGRVTLAGEDVVVPPKVALGLAIIVHELATNAAKHGALSTTEGRVALSWTLRDGTLEVAWQESDGPQVSAPARQGFGTALMRTTAEGELAGSIRTDYQPGGLRCEITIPLEMNAAAYERVPELA